MSRRTTPATVLYVWRCGAYVALAIGLVAGMLEVLDTETGKPWEGRLSRGERAEAVDLLEWDRVMRSEAA